MAITPKAIFVDFDGTLVDSLPALWKCYRLFLSRHGIDGDLEEFASLMGPPIGEIVRLLKNKHHLESSVEALVAEYEDIVKVAYASHAIPFPWSVEVLQSQKAKGLKLAIVTAAYPSFVKKVLKYHGLETVFDAIFGSLEGEPHKPHPAIYQRALQTFQLEPHEVIAIEDSPSGISSACQAGIPTIAFRPDNKISIRLEGEQNPFFEATSWKDIGRLL